MKENNRIVEFLIILIFFVFVAQAHQNQPLKFTFADGSYIEHKYRSDGTLYERIERERVISTVNGTGSTTATYKTSGFTQVGDFILEGTIPTRMYIEGGYVTLNPYNSTNTATSYNYYVHDNQGSVRAVLNEQGELTQATDYSAYGVPSTRYAGTAANNHLHLGLEWQPMKGVSGYYNNARFRDALLAGMFYQQDPLAEKYHPFSPYHYGANNPLRYVDIDGQKLFAVHGTWAEPDTWKNQTQLNDFTLQQFGDTDYDYEFKWNGGNYAEMRTEAAKNLVSHIMRGMEGVPDTESITIIGHSHGGNVGIEAINMMSEMAQFEGRNFNLVTINTPVRNDYQLSNEAQQRVNHINVYDPKDPIQISGGNSIVILPQNKSNVKLTGEFGHAGRTFPNAQNISVDNPVGIGNIIKGQSNFGDMHNSHNRLEDWINKIKY